MKNFILGLLLVVSSITLVICGIQIQKQSENDLALTCRIQAEQMQELSQGLRTLATMNVTARMMIDDLASYNLQLKSYIEDHQLPVPSPNFEREFDPAPEPPSEIHLSPPLDGQEV